MRPDSQKTYFDSGLEESNIITPEAIAELIKLRPGLPVFEYDFENAKALADFFQSELLPYSTIKFRKPPKEQPKNSAKSQLTIATNLAASASAFFADNNDVFVVNSSNFLDLLKIISTADLKDRTIIIASIYNPSAKSFISVAIDLFANQITVTDSNQNNSAAYNSAQITNHLHSFLEEKFKQKFDTRITGKSALKAEFITDEVQSAFYCAINNVISIYKITRQNDEEFLQKLRDFFCKTFKDETVLRKGNIEDVMHQVRDNLNPETLSKAIICYASLYDAVVAPKFQPSRIHEFLQKNNDIFDVSGLVATIIKWQDNLDFKELALKDFHDLNSKMQTVQERALLWHNQTILTPDIEFAGSIANYFKIESELAGKLFDFVRDKKSQNAKIYFSDPEIAQEALAFIAKDNLAQTDDFVDLDFAWLEETGTGAKNFSAGPVSDQSKLIRGSTNL